MKNKIFKLLNIFLLTAILLFQTSNAFANTNQKDGPQDDSLETIMEESIYEDTSSEDLLKVQEENEDNSNEETSVSDIKDPISDDEITEEKTLLDEDKNYIEKLKTIINESENIEEINLDEKEGLSDKENTYKLEIIKANRDSKHTKLSLDKLKSKLDSYYQILIEAEDNKPIDEIKLEYGKNIQLIKRLYTKDQRKQIGEILAKIDFLTNQNSQGLDEETYKIIQGLIEELKGIEGYYSLESEKLKIKEENYDQEEGLTYLTLENKEDSDKKIKFLVKVDEESSLKDDQSLLRLFAQKQDYEDQYSLLAKRNEKENEALPVMAFLARSSYTGYGYDYYDDYGRDNISVKKTWSDRNYGHNPVTINVYGNLEVDVEKIKGDIKIENETVYLDNVFIQQLSLGDYNGWSESISSEKRKKKSITEDQLKEFFRQKYGIGRIKKFKVKVKDFTYTFSEEKVDGYKMSLQKDSYGNVIITNTPTSPAPRPEPNPKPRPEPGPGEDDETVLKPKVQIHKKIDYLGDGDENPDTNLTGEDNYRLYLDVEGEKIKKSQPTDLLFVIDGSNSMNIDDMSGDSYYSSHHRGMTRKKAVEDMVNHSGMVEDFLNQDLNNRVAFICFQTGKGGYGYERDCHVMRDWSHDFDKNIRINDAAESGTNYVAGLMLADDMLRESKKSGHKQAMIFLSDGVPTIYIDENGKRQDFEHSPFKKTREETSSYVDSFLRSHPNLTIHAVGVSKDINNTDISHHQSPTILRQMSVDNGRGSYIGVDSDAGELTRRLKYAIEASVSNIVIEDTLSDYVELAEDADIKVVKKNKEINQEWTLLENGQITDANNYGGGQLQGFNYDPSTKKVNLTFNPDYKLENNTEYILSYNVKISQKAKDEVKNGYGDVRGDEGTDYGDNATSSAKEGFRSNTEAKLFYNEGEEKTYPHPVVQARPSQDPKPTPPPPGPVVEDKKPEVKINKQIDFLGDKDINPDTDIQSDSKYKDQKDDLYRLYLDVEGNTVERSKPVDLLFVLDGSSSMRSTDMYSGYRNISRKDAMLNMINNSDLVPSFLGQNEGNRVAFLYFNGTTRNNRIKSRKSQGYSYMDDAHLIKNWSHQFNNDIYFGIPDRSMGTNYQAGLMLAEDYLSESEKDPNRRQALIFISDGVPTFWIDSEGNRRENGSYSNNNAVLNSKDMTKEYLDSFLERHPNLSIHGVGVSKDIYEENTGSSQSPEVLKYMSTDPGRGQYIGVKSDMNELASKLKHAVEASVSDVVIEDALSDKVDLFVDKPDVKVVKKNTKLNQEWTLLENGQFTAANTYNGVKQIQSFDYDPDTKKVILTFNPDYKLEDDSKYIVSYNVRVTQAAKDIYLANGKNYKDEKGDQATDYGQNSTSSGKAGFKSNTDAKVIFNGGKKYYPHPVIQVKESQSYELPTTGAGGVRLIKTIGGCIILLAGFSLVRKRKNV